ncbi:MAG: hypothetical protein KA369_10850 [Spirochaetes bacterium]|nr:hypothetical protein [Spirochaetota bacterium]
MKRYMRIFGILTVAAGLFFTACESGSGGGGISPFLALFLNGGDSGHSITAFSFTSAKNLGLSADVSGTISGTSIAVTVPYGTTVTALKATFTTTGKSVSVGGAAQTSGVSANDFTGPVTYTVTAADGSTRDYTVTVTVAINTAKEITAFGFTSAKNSVLSTNVTGAITGTIIAVTVPNGTASIANLIATFTTTGTSVKIGTVEQTSGTTANDFTSAKIYTVTAANGSTQSYTVTVTVASASAKEITAFSFPVDTNVYNLNHEYGIDLGTTISGTSITAKLPYGSTLVATFATSGASVTVGGVAQVSGVTSNDFTNPVTYRVTAADGSWQDYTVTVLFAPALGCPTLGKDNSSYWAGEFSTTTDTDTFALGLTCDAINAAADPYYLYIFMNVGLFYNRTALETYAAGLGATVTPMSDERVLELTAPSLDAMQKILARIVYVPPGEAVLEDGRFYIQFKNNNSGLRASARINITVNAPE